GRNRIAGIAGWWGGRGSGQAAGAAPSSVMNSRRLRSSMGSSPEPAVPAYRRLRMPRKRPQVLGADLKCSESQPRYPPSGQYLGMVEAPNEMAGRAALP